MKHLKLTLITVITFSAIPCYGIMVHGFLTHNIETASAIERSQLAYASDKQSYTSAVNGITFTYPTDLFKNPPIVQVSVKQNASHATTETYVAEVSENSVNSTTVMVYQVSSGVVTEAATNAITICLFAIDDSI